MSDADNFLENHTTSIDTAVIWRVVDLLLSFQVSSCVFALVLTILAFSWDPFSSDPMFDRPDPVTLHYMDTVYRTLDQNYRTFDKKLK